MKRILFIMCVILSFMLQGRLVWGQGSDLENGTGPLTSEVVRELRLRSLGPTLTPGRIADIAVDPRNRSVWYLACASGGLWKTTNRGNNWEPIFDKGGSYSLGCVTIDTRNPDIIWLGTGENSSNRSVGYGDGVYKSMDGGHTWTCMGLGDSQHIGKILVDPRNSNVVFVAAEGPLWSSGGDRGLFKTEDGGDTWKAVLEISVHTGITDIAFELAPDRFQRLHPLQALRSSQGANLSTGFQDLLSIGLVDRIAFLIAGDGYFRENSA